MVSPVSHSNPGNQVQEGSNQTVKPNQKQPAKSQPQQDTVTLSRAGDVDHDGDSK
jgi:hypothetical protein